MKIKVDFNFIMNFATDIDDPAVHGLSAIAFKQMALGSIAQDFEELFQTLLVQNPQILRAEVTHVEEWDED